LEPLLSRVVRTRPFDPSLVASGTAARATAVLLGALLLTLWVTAPAAAQDTSPPASKADAAERAADGGPGAEGATAPSGEFTLPALTVTATRTERRVDEVPESVSIADQETLERNQVQSLDDVLRTLPNVDMEGGPRRVRETPVIRGLSGNRVVTRIDGVRQNFQSGHKGTLFVEPDLLKTVEVVRGPASALYGSDALGGVLSLTTKDPQDFLLPGQRHGVSLKGGYQSTNEEAMGSPAVYGLLGEAGSYLLHYTQRDSEDLRLGGGELLAHSAESSRSGFGKLMWRPAPDGAVRLSWRDYTQEQEVPVVGEADDPTGASLVDRAIRTRTVRLSFDSEGAPHGPWNPAASLYTQRMEIDEARVRADSRDIIVWTTHGLELLNSSFLDGARLTQTLTYGTELYTDEQRSQRNGNGLLVFPNATATRTGFFLQDEARLGAWRITPGVRYDAFSTQAETVAGANENSHVSPKLGVVYALTSALSLHALYGEGFRAPSVQELYISGFHHGGAPEGIFVPNPALVPEVARNVEAGFTVRARDTLRDADRFLLRVAVFRNRITNFINTDVLFVPAGGTRHGVTCNSGGGCLFYRPDNLTRAELVGGELEAQYSSHPVLARVSYSQTRGEDLGDGTPINSIPQDKLVLEVQAALSHGAWRPGLRRTQTADQTRVTEAGLATPGYSTYDVFATFEPTQGPWQGLRVDAGVDNLADEKYRRHLSPLYEAGRNYKVSVGYRF
jgi:hemoglobin/transferrin/lactoferrin receptor protein